LASEVAETLCEEIDGIATEKQRDEIIEKVCDGKIAFLNDEMKTHFLDLVGKCYVNILSFNKCKEIGIPIIVENGQVICTEEQISVIKQVGSQIKWMEMNTLSFSSLIKEVMERIYQKIGPFTTCEALGNADMINEVVTEFLHKNKDKIWTEDGRRQFIDELNKEINNYMEAPYVTAG
ncbi:hypothetical protein ACEWAR_23695, partial [Vibrio parahaemolyticus]